MGRKKGSAPTPAIQLAERSGVTYSVATYEHDPRAESYADEAARALGLEPSRVIKTLVCRLPDGSLAVAMLRSDRQLSLKALAAAAGVKHAEMAKPAEAERATGYVTGAISPLGQRKRLPAFLDEDATAHETVFVSAGRRGLELELAPADLMALSGASVAPLAT